MMKIMKRMMMVMMLIRGKDKDTDSLDSVSLEGTRDLEMLPTSPTPSSDCPAPSTPTCTWPG